LTEGNTSITAVAVECGFNDSNYFSTVFKKQKGVTPLKFAKSVGK
jgi:AraC-like DNA-binding protein